MMKVANDVNEIWIILGNACNLKCLYCVQRLYKPSNTVCIGEKFYKFLEHIAIKNSKPCRIRFYGGEPLLYWENIKKIVEKFGNKFTYRMITNGTLINDDIIEFCNKNRIITIVSWDGSGSLYSRGTDVFLENKSKLYQLDNLAVHTVFNKYSPLKRTLEEIEKIDNEYYKEKNKHIILSTDVAVPYENSFDNIYGINMLRIGSDINQIFRQVFLEKGSYIFNSFAFKYYFLYKNSSIYDKNRFNEFHLKTFFGRDVFTVDLEGNLYAWFNDNDPIATVDWEYEDYYKKLIAVDSAEIRMNLCKNCSVVSLCRGNCKNIKDLNFACGIMRGFYYPMIKWFERLL